MRTVIALFAAFAAHLAIQTITTPHVAYPAFDAAPHAPLSYAVCTDQAPANLGISRLSEKRILWHDGAFHISQGGGSSPRVDRLRSFAGGCSDGPCGTRG